MKKGSKISKEHKRKISKANKGKVLSEEHKKKISEGKKGQIPWNKGIPHTEAAKKNMRKARKARKGKKLSEEHKEKLRQRIFTDEWREKLSIAGKKHFLIPVSIETRKKISDSRKGKNNPMWKGGITPINAIIRGSSKYKQWRKAIFERDNYTCQECNERGGRLNADHIKSFAHYPELRFELSNGRTLCIDCHKKTENYGGKSKCPTQKKSIPQVDSACSF